MKKPSINTSEDGFILKHTKLFLIVTIMISMMVSGLYLGLSWIEHEQTESQAAVMLAESLASQLSPQDLLALSGSQEDLRKPEYVSMKLNLAKLIDTTSLIRFAYLFGEQNGNLIFLVDSESPDSIDYSPPGQIYHEATDDDWESFRSGKTVMIDSATDRWGTWKSVLVPVTNPKSGNVIAVLGLDYDASLWNMRLQKQLIPDILIALLFMLFMIAMNRAVYHNFRLKALSDRTAFSEALYHSVFDQAPVGIAIVNNNKFVSRSKFGNVNVNPMFEKILGRTNQELSNKDWRDITHPDDLKADLDLFDQFKTGKIDGYTLTKRFLKPDGSYVWTYMKIAHFMDELQDNPMHLCLLEDITEEQEMSNSLKESERSKSVLLSNLPGMAYRYPHNQDWTMQFVSAGSTALTGYGPESFVNNKDISFRDLIAPEYRAAIWDEWQRVIADRVPFRYEYEIIKSNGERAWVLDMAQCIYGEHGEIAALEGIMFDISARKEIENRLKYTYEHDGDTGLYNITALRNLVINDAKNKLGIRRAVILINLSTVQRLNMAYGFNYARDLITNIAKILTQYATENRMLFKTYESRFVYYIKGYLNQDELWEFSEILRNAMSDALKMERIGAGIGILEMDDADDFDLNKITKRALIASFKAINLDENEIGICLYDSAMEVQIQREEDIKQELANIAENRDAGHFSLQFQPILDLPTNRICSFEALARLKTNKLGPIPPLEFIPIAEMTKLIIPIGWEIIHQALVFLKKLESLGYHKIGVAINVSAIQLLKSDFTKRLIDMIDEMQVTPSNIDLEITESVFASDFNEINTILAELRDHGLKISIDDFGTGYSSLARESELHVDCLKIDKSFIDKLLVTQHYEAIAGDIITMAHKRGHSVIAEGVEVEEQRQYLLNNGCDMIQGYIISKPLDEEAAIELLRQEIE